MYSCVSYSLTHRHLDDAYMFVCLQVNLIGPFNVLRLAAARMAKNTPDEEGERGVLVNVSSAHAFDGQSGRVAYTAAKGGINAMTLPLARDLAQYGIRVNAVAPGT